MASYYYVNKETGYHDNHVVHAAGCKYLAPLHSRQFLGTFYTPVAAIQQARKYYAGALGCEHCCPAVVKKNRAVQNNVALRHMSEL